MKTRKRKLSGMVVSLITMISTISFMTSCDTAGENAEKGQAMIQITDQPADDSNISAAYVTISGIEVDGQAFAGFENKVTINLMDYQNGMTKVLGVGDLDVGSYNRVTLVLDADVDENGNSPGCFILTNDMKKHKLATSTQSNIEIDLQKNFSVNTSGSTTLVIDFDLRKTIMRSMSQTDTDFQFVSEVDMENSIRLMDKNNTGTIKGNYNSSTFTNNDKVVVYAYQKGTWDVETEVLTQTATDLRFKNAVTSAEVDASGNYKLSFLEPGEYEIHFVAFQDELGKMNFEALFDVSSLTQGILPESVTVGAQTEATINVIVIGKII